MLTLAAFDLLYILTSMVLFGMPSLYPRYSARTSTALFCFLFKVTKMYFDVLEVAVSGRFDIYKKSESKSE
jgi:hypothetical protein